MSLHTAVSEIPSIAFGSPLVLAVQLTLLFFYAALLLLVPVVRALSDGALPIELSLKGARWTEGIDDLSHEVFERLTAVERKATVADVEIKSEIKELRKLTSDFRSEKPHRNQ